MKIRRTIIIIKNMGDMLRCIKNCKYTWGPHHISLYILREHIKNPNGLVIINLLLINVKIFDVLKNLYFYIIRISFIYIFIPNQWGEFFTSKADFESLFCIRNTLEVIL